MKITTKRRQKNALAIRLTILNSFDKLVIERYDNITMNNDNYVQNINISTANVPSVLLVASYRRHKNIKAKVFVVSQKKKLKLLTSVKITKT